MFRKMTEEQEIAKAERLALQWSSENPHLRANKTVVCIRVAAEADLQQAARHFMSEYIKQTAASCL